MPDTYVVRQVELVTPVRFVNLAYICRRFFTPYIMAPYMAPYILENGAIYGMKSSVYGVLKSQYGAVYGYTKLRI